MEITEFLLARIAEDEEAARAAADVTGESNRWWVDGPAAVSGKHWVYATGEKFKDRAVAEHIARHDPARVLAECEAKRRIVEEHPVMPDASTEDHHPELYAALATEYEVWERHLTALASVYADHPDYRPEWRP